MDDERKTKYEQKMYEQMYNYPSDSNSSPLSSTQLFIFIPPRNPRFLRCWHSQPVAFEEDVVVVVVVFVVVVMET